MNTAWQGILDGIRLAFEKYPRIRLRADNDEAVFDKVHKEYEARMARLCVPPRPPPKTVDDVGAIDNTKYLALVSHMKDSIATKVADGVRERMSEVDNTRDVHEAARAQWLAKFLVDENVVVLDRDGTTLHKYGTLLRTIINDDGKVVAVVRSKCGETGTSHIVTMHDVRDADIWCDVCYYGVADKLRRMNL